MRSEIVVVTHLARVLLSIGVSGAEEAIQNQFRVAARLEHLLAH